MRLVVATIVGTAICGCGARTAPQELAALVDAHTDSIAEASADTAPDGDVDVAMPDAPLTVAELAVGEAHACAMTSDGTVWCWGSDRYGALGRGTYCADTECPASAAKVVGLPPAVHIVANARATCARTSDGEVWCWGRVSSEAATFCEPARPCTSSPTPILERRAISVALLPFAVCTLDLGRRARCAGVAAIAEKDVSTLDGAEQLAAGTENVCGRFADGTVRCVGPGAIAAAASPGESVPGLRDAQQVSVGGQIACATRGDGEVACWGTDENDEMLGSGPDLCAPQCPPGPKVRCAHGAITIPGIGRLSAISMGSARIGGGVCNGQANAICGLRADGEVWCWGRSWPGLAACDASGCRAKRVLGLDAAIAIGVGPNHACAATGEGSVFCWGRSREGQLLVVDDVVRELPVRML